MSEKIDAKQQELAALIHSLSPQDGVHRTTIPSVFLIRESVTTEPIARINEPSFCIILQGKKEVVLGKERLMYGAGSYIVASVDLPVTGQVIQASTTAPYLALKMEFTPSQVFDVVRETNRSPNQSKDSKRAMFVSDVEPPMLDAVLRLSDLLEHPKHAPVLAPLLKKEIIYWILQSPHGEALTQMAVQGSRASSIREVIQHIITHYEEAFAIEDLAAIANMSVSSLHRHFKNVTAMTPIQFQKQRRLQEARRLLLTAPTDIADIAFQVGYESPSQFSREYARMFGCPPRTEINRRNEENMPL